MGQIKNIKLHIVTDIKSEHKRKPQSRFAMFLQQAARRCFTTGGQQQVARRFFTTGRPLQVEKDVVHTQLHTVADASQGMRSVVKAMTGYIIAGTLVIELVMRKFAPDVGGPFKDVELLWRNRRANLLTDKLLERAYWVEQRCDAKEVDCASYRGKIVME